MGKVKYIIQKLINPISIILFAVILRLVPHPANFAPIAAMALFGGAYFDKKYALVIPLCAMLISDYFLGFHPLIPFVYASFLLTGIMGLWLKKRKNSKNILFASVMSSIMFFLITNFAVWLMFDMYPKTINGLISSYFMAVPFFRNTILGDLFYTGLFFGGYELVLRFIKRPIFVKKYSK